MELAISVGLLILFSVACFAAVIFAAKKAGWARVIQYVAVAIGVRVAMKVIATNASENETVLIPLIAAAAVVILWPHIAAQRSREQAELSNEPQSDEKPKD